MKPVDEDDNKEISLNKRNKPTEDPELFENIPRATTTKNKDELDNTDITILMTGIFLIGILLPSTQGLMLSFWASLDVIQQIYLELS